MANPILEITDGTTTIDLIRGVKGFSLVDWTPVIADLKDDGVYVESSISDGRRLVSQQLSNTIETFRLRIQAEDQDTVVQHTQELRRLLNKARDYWTTTWQDEPVWLVVRGSEETNTRYAIIHNWKTPQDDNPFSQPFFTCPNPIIDDFTLLIERGHWCNNPPDESDCVEISGRMGLSWPIYLEFADYGYANSMHINCTSNAALDDLHSGDFTVEAWIYPTDFGEYEILWGSRSIIACKTSGSLTGGWYFSLRDKTGVTLPAYKSLYAQVDLATTDAISFGQTEITLDEWHHVAMVYDTATRTIRLYLDGEEVTYDTQQAGVGAAVTDASYDFIIGSDSDTDWNFTGRMGWVKVETTESYSASFTTPSRCHIPGVGVNTIAIWYYKQGSSVAYNIMGSPTGTITNADEPWRWGECSEYHGREATCSDEAVYVANKHNRAPITDIYVYDAGSGAYLTNPLAAGGSYPYDLSMSPPANGDCTYFGSRGGPFNSLIFDLSSVVISVASVVWEYWDGAAWSSLSAPTVLVKDNTVAFTTLSTNGVFWRPQSDWAECNLFTVLGGLAPDVDGWFVRARFNSAGYGSKARQGSNRHVYTVNWPYVEAAADQITGDLPAIIRSKIECNSDISTGAASGWFNRAIVSLRSVNRGSDFQPYLNVHSQNAPGIKVALGTNVTQSVDARGAAGYVARYNPTLSPEALDERYSWIMGNDQIAQQYRGRYRVFLRAYQANGVAGNIFFRIGKSEGRRVFSYEPEWVGPTVYTRNLEATFQLYDLGIMSLMEDHSGDDTPWEIRIYLQVGTTTAAADLYFTDVVLMPIDEWSLDTYEALRLNVERACRDNAYLDIDYIQAQNKGLRTRVRQKEDYGTALADEVFGTWTPRGTSQAVMHGNTLQRLYFLFSLQNYAAGSANDEESPINLTYPLQLWANSRYYSFRGSR